jgi:hypothetical protein
MGRLRSRDIGVDLGTTEEGLGIGGSDVEDFEFPVLFVLLYVRVATLFHI